MTDRKAITLGMKLASLYFRGMVKCVICKDPIESEADTQWDHRHALCFDGPHEAENVGPAHLYCHALKTKADVRAWAKIRRLRGELKPKVKRPIRSAGFNKTKSRGFGGVVRPREKSERRAP